MPQLEVTREVCVNGWPVQGESVEAEVVDPYNLANVPEDAKHKALLVDLKASGNLTWLQKSLDLPKNGSN